MKKNFSAGMKLLCFFASFFIASLFFSCTVYDIGSNPLGGHNLCVKGNVYAEEGGPGVKGIKVSSDWGVTTTNSEGYYEILAYLTKDELTTKIQFKDVDGSANYGEFRDVEITVEYNNCYECTVLQDIILEKK